MSLISPHWLAMRPTLVFYCDTVYQRQTTLLLSASKQVNFSSRPNLKFLRFLLFLNLSEHPPPFKTKSTIVSPDKIPFSTGDQMPSKHWHKPKQWIIYLRKNNLNIFQTLHNLLNESKISLVFKRFHVENFVWIRGVETFILNFSIRVFIRTRVPRVCLGHTKESQIISIFPLSRAREYRLLRRLNARANHCHWEYFDL
jgi:hypothetical protein